MKKCLKYVSLCLAIVFALTVFAFSASAAGETFLISLSGSSTAALSDGMYELNLYFASSAKITSVMLALEYPSCVEYYSYSPVGSDYSKVSVTNNAISHNIMISANLENNTMSPIKLTFSIVSEDPAAVFKIANTSAVANPGTDNLKPPADITKTVSFSGRFGTAPTVTSSTESSITVGLGDFSGIYLSLSDAKPDFAGAVWVGKDANGINYPLNSQASGQAVCSYSSNSSTVTFSSLAQGTYYIYGRSDGGEISKMTTWATTPSISQSDVTVTSGTVRLPYSPSYRYSIDGITFVSPTSSPQRMTQDTSKNIFIQTVGALGVSITGLDRGTQYKIYVRVADSNGNTVSNTLTLNVTTPSEPPRASVYMSQFNSITFYFTPGTLYKIGDSSWTSVYLMYPTSSRKAVVMWEGNEYPYYFDDATAPSFITFEGLASDTTYDFSVKYSSDGDENAASFKATTLRCLHRYRTTTDPDTHIITHVCAVCGHTYTEIEHIHKWTVIEKVDATCFEDGYIKEVCDDCCEERTTVIESVGHKMVYVIKDSTCTEHGYLKYVCSVCGEEDESRYEEYPLIAHNPGEEEVTEGTCTEHGKITVRCNDCGEILSEKETPMVPHTPGKAVTVEPTCTEAGYRVVHCDVCGEELSRESISATGHKWTVRTTPSTCTEHGHTVDVCSVCGAEREGSEAELPLAEHQLEWVTVILPTETTDGKRTQVCAVCGEEFGSEAIEKLIKLSVSESGGKSVYELIEDNDTAPVGYVVSTFKGDGSAIKVIFSSGVTVELNSAAASSFASENAKLGVYKVTKADDATGDIVKAGFKIGNCDVYEIYAENADFDSKGTATVTVDCKVEDGYRAMVYYVNENGRKTFMASEYSNGKLTFKTNHFSTYVVEKVVYDAAAGLRTAIILSCVIVIATAAVIGYLIFKTRISRKDRFRL